jgi:hypothetical protein
MMHGRLPLKLDVWTTSGIHSSIYIYIYIYIYDMIFIIQRINILNK